MPKRATRMTTEQPEMYRLEMEVAYAAVLRDLRRRLELCRRAISTLEKLQENSLNPLDKIQRIG